MSELTSMMNIGKEMANKLISVGIESSEELIETGAKNAFLKLKQKQTFRGYKKGIKRIQRFSEKIAGV